MSTNINFPKFGLPAKKKLLIYAGLLGGMCAFCMAPLCAAQVPSGSAPPIRVESDQVVVPVLVLDKKRVNRLKRMNPTEYANEATSKNADLLYDLAIRGLDIKDFHLFEDGKEQLLGSVLFETDSGGQSHVHDNLGVHKEIVGVGSGIWTVSVGWDLHFIGPAAVPHFAGPITGPITGPIRGPHLPDYLLAYSPPSSPDGSCHELTIRLDRPDSLVYARKEYCSVRHSAADPLKETALGREMQSDLASKKSDKIPLSLMVVPFLTTGPKSRVDISIEWPAQSFKRIGKDCQAFPEIAVSGAIYRKDGDMALQFSDLSSLNALADQILVPWEEVGSCTLPAPNRYETQIYLDPGEFSLRVILKSGEEYGRVEVPLSIPAHDVQQLAVSGIALAKGFREAKVRALDASAKSAGVFVPLISDHVQYTPTTNPSFRNGEGVYFYTEVVYPQEQASLPPCSDPANATSAQGGCAPTLQALLRIVNSKTGEVVKKLPPINATRYAPTADPIISIGGGIHISDLPKGLYRLEVQAIDSSGRASPWSTASFSMENAPLKK